MARAETQRLKLLYLYDYFHRCTDEDHPASIAALQAYLNTLQIPAERKTLYTDLQLLQEFGLDLVRVREGHHFSYYLGSRTFELPEVRLLVDAVQSSRFLTEKKSAALIRKLAQLSSEHQAGLLERQVVVAGRVKTMDESIYYAVDAIQSAIVADCCIRFDYTEWGPDKQRHKRGPSRIATPWALVWHEEYYYLIAYTQAHGITHYRVDKMRRITALAMPRQVPPELAQLDLARYGRQVFGMFNGPHTTVKMQFSASLAGVVIDRFGTDLMLIPQPDGTFTVTTEIALSPVFYSWIISFGSRAKILAPQRAIDSCRTLCQQCLAQYAASDDAPDAAPGDAPAEPPDNAPEPSSV